MEINITITTPKKKLYFNHLHINDLTLFSESNLSLPYLEGTVNILHFPDIQYLKDRNLKVEVEFKYSDKSKKYEFITTEQEIEFNEKNAVFKFFAFPTWYSDILKERIVSFNDGKAGKPLSSVDCIKKLFGNYLTSIKPLIDFKTDDKQIWIQYNNKTIDFLREVILHSYVADKIPLVGFRKDNIFMFLDYDKQIKKDPVLTIRNLQILDSVKIHFGNAIKDTFFAKGVKVREFKLIDEKETRIPSTEEKHENEISPENAKNEKDFTIAYKVNFGNTHKHYNQAPLLNQSKWYMLENNTLILEMKDFYDYDLFDVIKIKFSVRDGTIIPYSFLNGEYVITGIVNTFKDFGNDTKTILKITKKDA